MYINKMRSNNRSHSCLLFVLTISLLDSHFAASFVNTRTWPAFESSFAYLNRRIAVTKREHAGCRRLSCFRKDGRICLHSTAITMNEEGEAGSLGSKSTNRYDNISFQDLGLSIGANSPQLLRLSNPLSGNERGIYTNDSIAKGNIVLSIPLSSCIRDDTPPNWCEAIDLTSATSLGSGDSYHNNPSEWAMRLAASLLDLKLNKSSNKESSETNCTQTMLSAKKEWLSMMPDPDYLRATLPIHWPERIISKAKCTALELSIDAAFFSREEIVESLLSGMKQSGQFENFFAKNNDELRNECHDALDLVQTRSCRVYIKNREEVRASLRVLAPMFDFINHASSQHEGEGSANAYFGLEGLSEDSLIDENPLDYHGKLVVRARRDIINGEEVLIDYGDSARPSWKCLTSYGFLPKNSVTSEDTDANARQDENVAELFMDGTRYEIGRDTIPSEMVEAATASFLEEEESLTVDRPFRRLDSINDEVTLSPEVATRIANRATDAAYQLCIDANTETEDKFSLYEDATKEEHFESVSNKLATSLCLSQHQVLLACAAGLQAYAAAI